MASSLHVKLIFLVCSVAVLHDFNTTFSVLEDLGSLLSHLLPKTSPISSAFPHKNEQIKVH